MIVLGIETSSPLGSLAVLKTGQLLAQRTWQRGKSHSEVVTHELKQLLREAEIDLRAIDRLAVSAGPGSFTGLRVGINLARSLGYALNRPVAVFDSLRVLADPVLLDHSRVLAMANAFRNLLYVAFFENGVQVLGPEAMTLETLEPLVTEKTVVVGDGFSAFETFFSDRLKSVFSRPTKIHDFPSALTVAALASAPDLSPENLRPWFEVKPLYIRASEAEERLREGLLKPFV